MSKDKVYSIKTILAQKGRKLLIGLTIGVAILVVTNMVLSGFHDHQAFCFNFSQRLSDFGPQLGRELTLGEWDVSQAIFNDFKKSIKGFGKPENLELVRGVEVPQAECTFNLASTYVEYPIYFANHQIAAVKGKIEHLDSIKFFAIFAGLSLILFACFKLWTTNLFRSLEKELLNPLRAISRGENLPNAIPLEVKEIDSNFKLLKKTLAESQKETMRLEKNEEIGRLAFQVAHDLRSPLWVLTNAEQIPDHQEREGIKESALHQIIGISDKLLSLYRQGKNKKTDLPVFVGSVLRAAVNEKRLRHRLGSTNLRLEFEMSELDGLANVDRLDLSVVLSNILQNAVEAIDKPDPLIEVRLKPSMNEKSFEICISDNGRGVPPHILPELFKEGITFGKGPDGTGLGLFNARRYLESVGGGIKLKSKQDIGTQVTIILPRSESPKWLAKKVAIPKGAKVIVIDDDPSVRGQWRSRLTDFETEFFEIYDENIFLKLSQDPLTFFIVDYQISHQGPTGAEIIVKHELQSRALLSTSYFDENVVIDDVLKHNLKLLPKSVLATVPIGIVEGPSLPREGFALIDDSKLIRITWKQLALKAGIDFFPCEGKDDFLGAGVPKSAPIFVDLDLGNGQDGITVAEELHGLGYMEIHLSTGSEGFLERPVPPFIKSVRDKSFPFKIG